jgi:HD-GYP domain-containing protein (c-di-GMP phosphodiesterase class II)
MHIASRDEVDKDLIDDFFYDFTESYERCERTLIALESAPSDKELSNDLFRSVHTIKGNLIYIGLKDLCPLLQSIEDLLELLRRGDINYDDLFSDVVLLAMDKTKLLVDENIYQQPSNIDQSLFENICQSISRIAQYPEADRPQAIYDAITLMDPQTHIQPPHTATPQSPYSEEAIDQMLAGFGVTISADLHFAIQLCPAVEDRSQFWQNRTHRITKLALRMNQQASRPVDPTELAMASYMHDISMAFLPLELLHKEDRFNSHDKKTMQGHVRLSHDLLHRMSSEEGEWEDACEIVLQHHERTNGSGYPKGLKEEEICDGAKILAIADTFDACRYTRAYRTDLKRPLVRAILEINRQSGELFSQYWVGIFNQVAKASFTVH